MMMMTTMTASAVGKDVVSYGGPDSTERARSSAMEKFIAIEPGSEDTSGEYR
jgi:hypothetical protein